MINLNNEIVPNIKASNFELGDSWSKYMNLEKLFSKEIISNNLYKLNSESVSLWVENYFINQISVHNKYSGKFNNSIDIGSKL